MALTLSVQKTIPNMIVHWLDQQETWASRNYTFYISKDGGVTFSRGADLKTSSVTCLLGRSRLITRAFRLGIRDCRKLESETILAIADKKIFRSDNKEFKAVHTFERGHGPLREGWCEDDKGNCYLGEYFLNDRRDCSVNLLKSDNDGRSWKKKRSLRNIRHIHCVQFDPISHTIWMGTGDRDNESSISFSENGGETWTEIGSGNQMFRAVSLVFTDAFVYWGSDAPTQQNYIYRYVRKSGNIERMVPVAGPVHYSTILEHGTILFATTSEGESEGKSAAWDRKAHIWASEDGTHWTDVASWEKDGYPYVLGFGRVYFPHGRYRENLFFTTEALKKVDNTLFCARLSSEK